MDHVSEAWPRKQRCLWVAAAVAALAFNGPGFVRVFRPAESGQFDFFQEWASARNRLEGLPVYTPHRVSLPRYLGRAPVVEDRFLIEANAHPPTSVLLALPLAPVNYRDAHLVWNVFSLLTLAAAGCIIVHGLRFPCPWWSSLPIVAVLMGEPLRFHLVHGQLNCLVLLLITATWTAERTGRCRTAGAFLAAAATVKLFPALLFVYFLARRRWRVVGSGLGWTAGLTLTTVVVLGPQAYRDYLTVSLPGVGAWRTWWHNMSLPGFWNRLFNPGGKGFPVIPVLHSPALAWAGILASAGAVLAILVVATTRAGSRDEEDGAFGLTVVAMLLLSPVCWHNYAVLLFLPLAWLARRLPLAGLSCGFLGLAVALLWVPPETFWRVFGLLARRSGPVAHPWQSVTVLSTPLYGLLVLFVLGSVALGRLRRQTFNRDAGRELLVEAENRRPLAQAA